MTNLQLAQKLNATVITQGEEKEIPSYYVGDLLSFVMGRAKAGCCWFTIMSNVNVLAVATLLECACVVLCEGVAPDQALKERAESQGIMLLSTALPLYEAAVAAKD